MNNQENAVGNATSEEKKPLTISELARLHLTDPNHTTTDEEMRNATLELTENVEVDEENLYEVDNTTVIPAMSIETSEEENEEGRHDKDEASAPNPYDVLK